MPVRFPGERGMKTPGFVKIAVLLGGMGGLASPVWAFPGAAALLQLRLRTPLTTDHAEAGSRFETVVTAPGLIGGRVFFPAGTQVLGVVVKRQRVGLGFVHERAGLDVQFQEYRLPDGRRFRLRGVLREIDNSREAVDRRGHVEGILPSDNPQGMLGGLWHSPSAELFQGSFLGITGLAGRLFSSYAMGPLGAGVLLGVRCAFFRAPEPEIRLPVGTDMELAVTEFPDNAPAFDAPAAPELPAELAKWLEARPFGVDRTKGRPAGDMINLAFVGSREELVAAFHAAGWAGADPETAHTVSHLWNAFASQTGYADAPASRMTYGGREPDFVFQKSLNDIAKRHHVRLWREEADGREVWLGAATHDVNIKIGAMGLSLTHRIDPRIDGERGKVLNDLAFAGCATAPAYVERNAAIRNLSERKLSVSDGRLAATTLLDCSGRPPEATDEIADLHQTRAVKVTRRVVLAARQYLFRDNLYYWTYRVVRWHSTNAQESYSDDGASAGDSAY